MLSQILKRSIPALVVGMSAGIVGNQAAAIEEVVVYGTDTSKTTINDGHELRAEMRRYVIALNDRQKAILNVDFASKLATKIQLAAAESPTRG